MFYPSSTWPLGNAKDTEDLGVWHEGDWEMMQVAVKMDKDEKKLIPEGATASQHYYGQTLDWTDVKVANKYNPVIYIAAGSHATYFKSGVFNTQTGNVNQGVQYEKKIKKGPSKYPDYTDRPREKEERYKLQPFEPMAPAIVPIKKEWWPWLGHWGEYDLREGFIADLDSLFGPGGNSGPRSPRYRGTAVAPPFINIFTQPLVFYETYKRK